MLLNKTVTIPFLKNFEFKPITENKNLIKFLWFGLSLVACLKVVLMNDINNYKIFKYTFINLTHFHSLYTAQPNFYFDTNHYGPLFAFIIAPFTLLDDYTGCILWVLTNSFMLYWAIMTLPLALDKKLGILLISAHELMTSSYSVQFNPIMTSLILFTYTMVHKKEDFWAAFFIVVGTFVKLYGIMGLVFFFFSRDKKIFIASLVAWFGFLLVLPMVVSSSSFVIQTYQEWANSLIHKNFLNMIPGMQDISVMGMIRRISGNLTLPNFWVLVPAMILFFLPIFLYFPRYTSSFKLSILASTLMFPVLFSTGSESPTYIIAVTGLAIWYIQKIERVSVTDRFLLIFALILTSFSPSILFPQWVNEHWVMRYSLKALPVFLIWSKITFDVLSFWVRDRIRLNTASGYSLFRSRTIATSLKPIAGNFDPRPKPRTEPWENKRVEPGKMAEEELESEEALVPISV